MALLEGYTLFSRLRLKRAKVDDLILFYVFSLKMFLHVVLSYDLLSVFLFTVVVFLLSEFTFIIALSQLRMTEK